uniref:Kinesin motor domain-containing protein n=1 Tax=Fagus sylvatica TaxID=28930 RepID=A0A2N9FKI7_FAGSY
MENSEVRNGDSSQCVRVAVNVRPLITPELLLGCTDCISVVPGEPQVQIGSHSFTYDHVYGSMGSPSTALYDDCVAPLVDALFHGYNATVLAYGQTGSGKTYTMGTNYSGEGSNSGVIPKVMDSIFKRVEVMKDSSEFLIRVAFIEIFKEEVFDLLDPNSSIFSKAEGAFLAKPSVPARVPIQIRETVHGGITLAGVTEAEVRTKEEMATYLTRGSQSRATGSTNMNSQSSRSHAIFTITMEQKKVAQCLAGVTNDEIGDDILCAKLHLVDLAGSERAKRTGADGMRFKEGIHINKGLLALGNVISALGDEKKRKEGGHVPYRDSKLTRLLQARGKNDSLGGNSKTVMIACVSPADTNAEETLNTLKYANRARNIQNKAVINRDPMAAQMQRMRSQIEQLQAELLFYRGDASAPFDELQRELQERKVTSEHLTQRALDAQVEKDQLAMKIESARNAQNAAEFVDCVESDDDGFRSKNALFPCTNEFSSDYDMKVIDIPDETEDEEKELEHSSLQEKLDMELKELDKKLEQKEKEIEELRCNLSNISSTSDDGAQKLKEEYLQKLNVLESQVSVLKKKQDAQAQLLRQKQKSDEAAKRLHDEIQRIKTQKVQLQHKIKQESEQFRLWKASREKEVLQVLQRKTEEASMATKRLKELLESRKASSRETFGAGNGNGPGIQALEHELEVTVRVHEVRAEYERQLEERARMAKEVARLKEEADLLRQSRLSDCPETMSPGARNSRIFALENMLATSSSTLVSMASQLSEAEERERGFSGRGRWNQIRCMVRDKEVAYREKDLEIRDLKEKVVKLSSYVRQLEMQKTELIHQVKSQNSALKKHSMRMATDGVTDPSNGGHNYDLRKLDHRSSFFLLEDMDTSESEHSAIDENDDEWVVSRSDIDINDEDWALGKRRVRKRNSRTAGRTSVASNLSDNNDSGSLKLDSSGEGIDAEKLTTASGVCCSCSKYSFCKTTKCQCRVSGGSCGTSCGCLPTKCANRGTVLKEVGDSPESESAEGNGNGSGSDETEKSHVLASHGAMLLQSALVEKPAEENDDNGPKRKPLSDIGNKLAKSNAPKPIQRKKWRKSTILLVSDPPPSSQPENTNAPQKPDNNSASEAADIPLKLPRAMRLAASNSGNPLRERNAGQSDESVVNKESGILAPTSPVRQRRVSEEKENNGL